MTDSANTSVTAQFGAGEREEKTKLVYVKRWRTIVRLPEQYADEIVEALRAAPVSHTSVKDGGGATRTSNRIKELESALMVFFRVLRGESSFVQNAYELHVSKADYGEARDIYDRCIPDAAQAPGQPTGSDAVADGARETIDRAVMAELTRQHEAGVKYLSGINVDDLVSAIQSAAPVKAVGSEALREAVESAIRDYFKLIGSSAVMSSDGIERVYYSGFSLNQLAKAVAAALATPQAPAQTEGE